MNKDSQCQHCGQEWDASHDRTALVRLVRVLICGGDWHIYQLKNDLEEWEALSQELRDLIGGEDAK